MAKNLTPSVDKWRKKRVNYCLSLPNNSPYKEKNRNSFAGDILHHNN